MFWLWATLYVLFFFQLSAIFTTVYLHRAATHKALTLNPVVELLMRAELWLYTGIVTREWVAVHRKHHHFTDVPGDPHSPYIEGLWEIIIGNPWYYKREAGHKETIEHYAKDIPSRWHDRLFLDNGMMGILIGLGLTMGFVRWLSPGHAWWYAAALGLGLYLTQAILYILANALINGACHALGYKNFSNTATNLRWVAWLSAGEGLHNNHHQFPSASKLSMRKTEVDPGWPVIRLLRKLSLAQVKPLPEAAIARQSSAIGQIPELAAEEAAQ